MVTDEQPRCTACGAVLAAERPAGDPEDTRARAAAPAGSGGPLVTRVLEGDELMYAVAGVLFLGRALRPGERLYVQEELAQLGVWALTCDVFHQVERLRRRGLEIEAVEREPGYALVSWPFRFRRRRSPQLRLFRPAVRRATRCEEGLLTDCNGGGLT